MATARGTLTEEQLAAILQELKDMGAVWFGYRTQKQADFLEAAVDNIGRLQDL